MAGPRTGKRAGGSRLFPSGFAVSRRALFTHLLQEAPPSAPLGSNIPRDRPEPEREMCRAG
jgi:hypothetical protein